MTDEDQYVTSADKAKNPVWRWGLEYFGRNKPCCHGGWHQKRGGVPALRTGDYFYEDLVSRGGIFEFIRILTILGTSQKISPFQGKGYRE